MWHSTMFAPKVISFWGEERKFIYFLFIYLVGIFEIYFHFFFILRSL